MPGSLTVTGLVTSGTRSGAISRFLSTLVPSGATSYTLANRTSWPEGLWAWPPAATGASRCSVTLGAPTTSAGALRTGDVNAAYVPCASFGGLFTWEPSTPDVSEYDVGAGPALAYWAEPATTFDLVAVSASLPVKYSVFAVPTFTVLLVA